MPNRVFFWWVMFLCVSLWGAFSCTEPPAPLGIRPCVSVVDCPLGSLCVSGACSLTFRRGEEPTRADAASDKTADAPPERNQFLEAPLEMPAERPTEPAPPEPIGPDEPVETPDTPDTPDVADVPDLPLTRSTNGLIAYYLFTQRSESNKDPVKDTSGVSPVMDLTFVGGSKYSWLARGGLKLEKGALSHKQAGKLFQRITATGELTVEVWCQPENLEQGGPARIVSFSQDTGNRNFTLGQGKKELELRLRGQDASKGNNGDPYVGAPNSIKKGLVHLVANFDGNRVRLFVNGQVVQLGPTGHPAIGRWNQSYTFLLANERTGDRQWKGTLYMVAIYDRALSNMEVARHHQLGWNP